MPNVWKVGSRWSPNGAIESCIIDVFRRNNYVFVGTESDKFLNSVRRDDYLAIADGFTVVAVAKVLDEKPTDLCELLLSKRVRFRKSDKSRFDFTDPEEYRGWCYGVRVHWVDLPLHERFKYRKPGTFYSANMYWDRIINLYAQYSCQVFDITAHTLRLRKTEGYSDAKGYTKEDLLDGKTIYTIPIYQREYSWSEDQINRFIHDIFVSYWGANAEAHIIVKDPMFIGTMQLSQKRFISPTESSQDIIDGQQRISTLLCLLKYLMLRYPNVAVLNQSAISSFDWLQTRVNNDIEDSLLREFCEIKDLTTVSSSSNNIYLRNCAIIGEVFNQNITDDNNHPLQQFNIEDFCTHLLNNVYFVVVETVAGLSKTVQIFNTINTAGLDLNGDDIFKVRFYEYLHDKCGLSDDAFIEIGKVYEKIKAINDNWRSQGNNWNLVSMSTVRDAYKDFIISKYDLGNSLYQMATDTFFEQLFDVLLNVQEHSDFGKNTTNVSLSLSQLNSILGVVVLWNSSYYRTPEELLSYKLIEKSRYGRYTRICYLLLISGYSIDQVYQLLSPLSKVYLCYSVAKAKTIYEIHTFSFNLQKRIGRGDSLDSLLSFINNKLTEAKPEKDCFKKALYKPIWKDLVCCISAYFDEILFGTEIKEIDRKLSGGYDIEHIHAYADSNVEIDDELQNSIGNLVLLEYDINRSIQDLSFNEKVNRSDGKKCYKDSQYCSVSIIRKSPKWDLSEIESRRETEYNRIISFIWGES